MKIVSLLLMLIIAGITYWLLTTSFFVMTKSYEYEGEIEPSHILVQDIYDANKKINSLMREVTSAEFFKIFRVSLARPCDFWDHNAKCRLNQCPIEEEQKLGNNTHIKTYVVNKSLTQKDYEFTNHIKIGEYNETHNGEEWIYDEHLDEDGIFVDLQKNPERFSGYNGSIIWNELYAENLAKLKFPTKGAHSEFLYRIISGVHVNINMHISKFYLDEIDLVEEVDKSVFYENYEIFYERIGKFPDRIKNLFYTYVFLLHAVDELNTFLPKYTYDTESQHANSVLQNKMVWFGHYINGLLDPELIESNLFLSIKEGDFRNIVKPQFHNITKLLD